MTLPDDVEATTLPEEDYQEILDEEQNDAEAEESAEEPQSRCAMMRSAGRRDLASGRAYARLFDGATLAVPSGSKGVRVFIRPDKGMAVETIRLDGTDITKQYDGHSILITKSNGVLEITTGVDSIDDVCDDTSTAPAAVYNLNGIYCGTSTEGLTPGLYIVRRGNKTTKVAVNQPRPTYGEGIFNPRKPRCNSFVVTLSGIINPLPMHNSHLLYGIYFCNFVAQNRTFLL